ncbi:response regulator transcription factor [Streptomyces sp. NPDC060184]|uniref:helix-turn-helix transcriptional regulator n=1 Tax=Streptomyces sp. NPDC060184 TaxID=3347064 RepID=UPI00365064C9
MSGTTGTSDIEAIGTTGRAADGSAHRIGVVVHARDPISEAGVASQLRQHPVIELRDEAGPGAVAVLVEETPDERSFVRLRQLARGDGASTVLVVSALRESELLAVVECGVGAVVWRHEATTRRLSQAVIAASRGEGDLPADLLGRLMGQVESLRRRAADDNGTPSTRLTAREAHVLRLVAEGLDNPRIAAELACSERTVKNVLHGLTLRFHLRNRAHAVAYAVRQGFI